MINPDTIIAKVDEFPTLPTIYSTLLDTMANPRSTANDVADVISQDQASASKVLKASNSSIYGFRGKINTISQAIVFIGFDEVKNLVTALSIINLFKDAKKSLFFNPIDLWKHSLAVGVISRQIGRTVGVKNLENYFLAGILHDIGKLLFFKIMPDDYSDIINYAIEQNITIRDAEQEKIGITHTVAGEMLAEKWKLPSSLKNAIRYHTTGTVDGQINQLSGIVHIANITASMLGLGLSGEEIISPPNPKVWEGIQLPNKFFTTNLQNILVSFEESIDLLLKS